MRLKFTLFIRVLGIICFCLILFQETAVSVRATESSLSDNTVGTKPLLPSEDLTGELSTLIVHLEYTDDILEKVIPVPGTTIDLYKVADLYVEGGNAQYTLVEPFTSLPIDFENMSASASLEAASKLDAFIATNDIEPALSGATDSDGIYTFAGLTPGIYLGKQRTATDIDGRVKVTMLPVLWLAPMYELNDTRDMYVWNYKCDAYPKESDIESIPTPTPTSTPTPTNTPRPTRKPTPTITRRPTATLRPTSTPRPTATPRTTTGSSRTTIVKTGDNSPIMLYVVLLVAAAAVIGIIVRKKNN